MQPGSPQPRPAIKRRRRFLRPLLATLVITILLTACAYAVLPTIGKGNGFEERELKLGSTTFRFECDDDEPDEFFQHESWDVTDGELSSGRRIAIGLPLITLKFGYEYEPLEAIRARLPTNDITRLAALLESKNHFEVFAVAGALYENPEGAVSTLPKLIAATEKNAHLAPAIDAIARTAPRQSVPALITGLSSTNKDLRHHYTYILSSLGTNALPAAPAVLAAFQSKRIDAVTAAQALQNITGDCSITIPALRDELKKGPPDQRIHILRTLDEAGHQAAPALPEVLAILNSSAEPRTQASALETLSHLCPDENVLLPHIRAALGLSSHDTNPPTPYQYTLPPNVRAAAAINALARLGSAGVPHLIPLYQGTNIPVKAAAGRALAKIGPPAAAASESIRAELQSSRVEDVALACNIVASLGTHSTELLPTLTNLLFVPNTKTRAHAAITLTQLGHHNDTITRILADSFADISIASQVFKTVQPILQTNSTFKTIFTERLALNRKAARSYQNHAVLFTDKAAHRSQHFCCWP
jgi:HEAT repeat protein